MVLIFVRKIINFRPQDYQKKNEKRMNEFVKKC